MTNKKNLIEYLLPFLPYVVASAIGVAVSNAVTNANYASLKSLVDAKADRDVVEVHIEELQSDLSEIKSDIKDIKTDIKLLIQK